VVGVPRRGVLPPGRHRGATAAANTANPGEAHQPGDLVAAPPVASPAGGMPQLQLPIQPPMLRPQIEQGVGRIRIGEFGVGGSEASLHVRVVGARGDRHAVGRQHATDRLDPEPVTVGPDVVDYDPSRRSSSAWAKNADAVLRISFARRS
jgi:hypothetical protein